MCVWRTSDANSRRSAWTTPGAARRPRRKPRPGLGDRRTRLAQAVHRLDREGRVPRGAVVDGDANRLHAVDVRERKLVRVHAATGRNPGVGPRRPGVVGADRLTLFELVAMSVKKDLALELVKKYEFNATKQVYDQNILFIPDYRYHFDCFFEYEDQQYMLRVVFKQQLNYGNFVNVNITRNDFGIPHIINDEITVIWGGFNSTVLFHNNLDQEIILSSDDPIVISVQDDGDIIENRFVKKLSDSEMVIPPGKFFSYLFSPYRDKNAAPIGYTIKPFNLEGSVTVKPYPRCMTENEVNSLYNQVKVYPKFPTYLPEGYSFECGMHNTNAYVHLAYWNDSLREKFEDKSSDSTTRDFFASGGLTVDYYDEAENGWIEDPLYDKFEKAKENAAHPWAKTLSIAGEPAVMMQEYFWKDGEQLSFYRLQIFLDEEEIRIRSGLPESEIIKVAESFFAEQEN